MELKEFLEKFLPDYDSKRKQTEASINPLFACIEDTQQRITWQLADTDFEQAIEHCLRRQRELCALEYWKEAEAHIDWKIYEKIKQANLPQNYCL
ncbi:MAG: hypothetical protein LBP85_08445 [Prevotellaceae bacterium]|jgi:hypothetical protein|nr:hypothetical protein [Prevotellaceae bacterium]